MNYYYLYVIGAITTFGLFCYVKFRKINYELIVLNDAFNDL